MSVALPHTHRDRARSVAGTLGDAVTVARAQSLENRRCTRRVRHEVRDGLGVILFSAAASTALAVLLTLVLALAG